MKTKLVLLASLCAILYSCSNEENEDLIIKNQTLISKKETFDNFSSNTKEKDSVVYSRSETDKTLEPIDEDGGDPKDVPPRR